MTLKSKRLGNQKPRIDQYNNGDIALAEKAITLADEYMQPLLDWQKLVLRRWLALDEDGKYTNKECGLSISRQSGKTELLIVRIIAGMVFNGDTIIYTAQSLATTNEIKRRVARFFYEGKPEIRNMLTDEFDKKPKSLDYLELRNGGRCVFNTRTRSGGLGFTSDVLLVDEAAEYSDAQQEALVPTLSAGKNQNHQQIMATMPPTTGSSGTVFIRTREKVLAGKAPKFCWQEWGVESLTDPNDKDAWYDANPSLGYFLMESAIEAESKTMSIDSFNKQRLGWYQGADSQRAITDEQWDRLAVKEVKLEPDYRRVYAVKFAPDRSAVSLAVGLPMGDKIHVEIMERRDMSQGFSWLVRLLLDRYKDADKIIIDGAAGSQLLVEELYRSEKRIGKKILTPNVKEAGAAYGAFQMAVEQETLTHYNQPGLNIAIKTAKKRPIYKDGLFGYASTSGEMSSDAIEAVAFAYYGAQRFCVGERKGKSKQRIML